MNRPGTRARRQSRFPRLVSCALTLLQTGCATVLGTVVSPVTGGVEWAAGEKLTPLVVPDFVVGAVLAPFVAVHNGVTFDATLIHGSPRYGRDFHRIFRPFALLEADRLKQQQETERAKRRAGTGR